MIYHNFSNQTFMRTEYESRNNRATVLKQNVTRKIEEKNNMKIGVLFGAGAEIAYDMPSGMGFAANIVFPSEKTIDLAKKDFEAFLGKPYEFMRFSSEDFQPMFVSNIRSVFKSEEKKQHYTTEIDELGKITVETGSDFEILLSFLKEAIAYADSEKQEVEEHFAEFFSRLEKVKTILYDTKGNTELKITLGEKIVNLANEVFEGMIGYEQLLMEYYSSLFSNPHEPSPEFNKTASFLFIARAYVMSSFTPSAAKLGSYYNDIKKSIDAERIAQPAVRTNWVVATTNYSRIEKYLGFKSKEKARYLNGNVNLFLNLKNNTILDTAKRNDKLSFKDGICVPLLYLQSTVKPFLAFELFHEYLNLYNQFKDCKFVAVIGFGFNKDDGIINSMFRKLIGSGTEVIYFQYEVSVNSSLA